MAEPTEPIEAVNEIRRWMRHWLLRQYGEDGTVLPENVKLSEHLSRLLDYVEGMRAENARYRSLYGYKLPQSNTLIVADDRTTYIANAAPPLHGKG